jgi:hypothetical protein
MIKAWGIVFPDNFIMVDSNFTTEARAWRIALGWPSEEEIERAKRNGHRAVLLTIDVNNETAKAADEVDVLVQQLDVLLNGTEGAARQASLCDIVAQVAKMRSQRAWPPECEALCKAGEGMQAAINEVWLSEHPEDADDDGKVMDPEAAQELHNEAWDTLNTAIHYMRKRMERPFGLFSEP